LLAEVTSSLRCSDCKSSFNSASLLLQHFAQHVSQEATGSQLKYVTNLPSDDTAQCMQKHATAPCLQKKKTETILERVLKRNSALRYLTVSTHCEPGSSNNGDTRFPTKSTLSSLSPVLQTEGTDQTCSVMSGSFEARLFKNGTPAGLDVLVEIGQRAREKDSQHSHSGLSLSSSSSSSSSSSTSSSDVPLVKCDLQKRLENCVTKLVLKHENSVMLENNECFNEGTTISSAPNEKRQLHPTRNKPNSEMTANTSSMKMEGSTKIIEELDDFNPLKFCFVTLEESEVNVENRKKVAEGAVVKSPRGASGRKQKSPKKVYYQQNGKLNHSSVESELVLCDVEKILSSPTSKKKYPCHLCSKVFGWSTDLKRHILTHTGERPFKCDACEATFTRNFLLQKHQRKIHSSCFTMSQEIASSNLDAPSNEHQIWNGVKEESEHCAVKYMMQCSDDSDKDRLVICNDGEKPNRSVVGYLETKSQHGNWHKIHPAKKRKKCSTRSLRMKYFHMKP